MKDILLKWEIAWRVPSVFGCIKLSAFLHIFDLSYGLNEMRRIVRFYIDGFSNLPRWGRALWTIILIKLVIMFLVLKLFLMPDFLKKNFNDDESRKDYIMDQLAD